MKIRDVLLCVYSVGWLAALGVSLATTKKVPDALWAGLAFGIGGILALFRGDGTPPSPPAADREDSTP